MVSSFDGPAQILRDSTAPTHQVVPMQKLCDVAPTGKLSTAGLIFHISAAQHECTRSAVTAVCRYVGSRWLAILIIIWGIVSALGCLVNSADGYLVQRVALGLVEAGTFPGAQSWDQKHLQKYLACDNQQV